MSIDHITSLLPYFLIFCDFVSGVYFRQKIRTSATTPLTETTRTMPQPVTVDNSFNNVHLRNVVIGLSLLGGFAFLFSGFLVCYIYIPKRNARRRKREDAENVNDENGIELQPLRGTAEPEPSGTPVLDRNGDNQQHDATGTLIGAAFYERDRDCIRIDRLESLPAQRAQQPEVQEQKHSYP